MGLKLGLFCTYCPVEMSHHLRWSLYLCSLVPFCTRISLLSNFLQSSQRPWRLDQPAPLSLTSGHSQSESMIKSALSINNKFNIQMSLDSSCPATSTPVSYCLLPLSLLKYSVMIYPHFFNFHLYSLKWKLHS